MFLYDRERLFFPFTQNVVFIRILMFMLAESPDFRDYAYTNVSARRKKPGCRTPEMFICVKKQAVSCRKCLSALKNHRKKVVADAAFCPEKRAFPTETPHVPRQNDIRHRPVCHRKACCESVRSRRRKAHQHPVNPSAPCCGPTHRPQPSHTSLEATACAFRNGKNRHRRI